MLLVKTKYKYLASWFNKYIGKKEIYNSKELFRDGMYLTIKNNEHWILDVICILYF